MTMRCVDVLAHYYVYVDTDTEDAAIELAHQIDHGAMRFNGAQLEACDVPASDAAGDAGYYVAGEDGVPVRVCTPTEQG